VAVGSFVRAQKVIRDAKGHVLGFVPRTAEEVLAFILGNSVRDKKTGCLLSRLRKDEKGYARVNFGGEIRVHRVVFYKGRPAKGAPQVLHTCDVRHCIEETHLYAGNNTQNIADKVSRDRSGKKLNIAKVRRIKAMLAAGNSQKRLAEKFGVNRSIISRIKTGVRWAHVQYNPGPGSVAKSPLESGT
jgi:hypothetical protein